ncbi:MAG TPA: 50S ribosomal protein L5 [Candidatus Nanoarchaeia archaeon]|nr:50S ribosomal protein L5 [Candidatus Nanoarchaeia archaeon]
MSRLKDKYIKEVAPALVKEFSYSNAHQTPKVEKIVVNAGVGRGAADSKHLDDAISGLVKITGQAPVKTVAKKSIAAFKLREGNKIGAKVTLRGERMYEFLDRLISVALPRVRDFRGIPAGAFDPQGNYSLGINDRSIFPEIPYDEAGTGQGLQVNIITTAVNTDEGRRLLELMGMPLVRNE